MTSTKSRAEITAWWDNIKGADWKTTRSTGHPCRGCGKCDTCTESPDGQRNKCWRNGGQIFPLVSGFKSLSAPRRTPKPPAKKPDGKHFGTADEAIAALGKSEKLRKSTIADIYDYSAFLKMVRFNNPDGSKEFRPVHYTSLGWKIGRPDGSLPLYRLNEITSAVQMLFVTEGEKCCDKFCGLDLNATTSAHGSSSAAESDWNPVADLPAVIVFVPDNDAPGEKYVRDACRIIFQRNHNARIKIIRLPGLPPGGDIEQFIEARPNLSTEKLKIEITWLVSGAPFLAAADYVGGPVLVCAADVKRREVDWLWANKIPMGRISLLAGRPGDGKSFLVTFIAAICSTGSPWPDGTPCPCGSVILANAEDDAGDTSVPRCEANGADLRKILFLSVVRRIGEDGKPTETAFTLADIPALEIALIRTPDCKLIVIDPIGSYIGGSTDAHRDNEVRAVLTPLAALAEKYGCAVLIVAHIRKAGGSSADDLVMGSRAFTGIARVAWHLTRDKSNKSHRLLLPGKNNLAPEGDGHAFTIGGDPPRLIWEREPVKMTADEAIASETGDIGDAAEACEAKSAAVVWLQGELSDLYEHPVAELKSAALETGIKWRTLQRAALQLKIIRHRSGFGKGSIWRLPKTIGTNGTNGTNDEKSLKNEGFVFVPSDGTNDASEWRSDDGTNEEMTVDHSRQNHNLNGTNEDIGTNGTNEEIQGNIEDSSSSLYQLRHSCHQESSLGVDDYETQERLAIQTGELD